MRLYHLTPEGEEILTNGFKDSDGFFVNNTLFAGVWFSNVPAEIRSEFSGETQLMIEIPEDAVSEFELGESDRSCREFLVPAEVVKEYGAPTIV